MDHKQAIEILEFTREYINDNSSGISNRVREEYGETNFNQAIDHAINCVGAIEQIKCERDIAIQQLNELGYGFGEKIREEDKKPSTLEQLKVLKSSCEKNGIDVSLETFLEDKADKE